jgi:hypothetical protein
VLYYSVLYAEAIQERTPTPYYNTLLKTRMELGNSKIAIN